MSISLDNWITLKQPLHYLLDDSVSVASQNISSLIQKVCSRVSEEYQIRIQVYQIRTGIISLSSLGKILEIKTSVSLRCHRHL